MNSLKAVIRIFVLGVVTIFLFDGCQMVRKKSHDNISLQRQTMDSVLFVSRKQVLVNLNDSGFVCAVFPFQNITSDTLFVDTVRASCGCVRSRYPHAALPPGHEDSIVVGVDLSNVGASFVKTAIVYFHHKQPMILRVIGRKKNVNKELKK